MEVERGVVVLEDDVLPLCDGGRGVSLWLALTAAAVVVTGAALGVPACGPEAGGAAAGW